MSAIQGSGLEGCLQSRGMDERGSTVLCSQISVIQTLPFWAKLRIKQGNSSIVYSRIADLFQ